MYAAIVWGCVSDSDLGLEQTRHEVHMDGGKAGFL